MVLLGAFLKKMPVLSFEQIEDALAEHMPARHKHLLPLNMEAMRKGAAYLD